MGDSSEIIHVLFVPQGGMGVYVCAVSVNSFMNKEQRRKEVK